MFVSTLQEIFFAFGILLFAVALVLIGIVLRFLLQLIRLKIPLWPLPFISAGLIIIYALLHFHTTIAYGPKLNPSDTDLIRTYFQLQFFGSFILFLASVLAIIAGGVYFWRTSR
ncbi:MAG: hypothetical protein B6244_09050 [Candidatus Cloacimonetes bacterium 4572_55]|nr:MAG: hypothetical protein B6244_09050 [Candidatus Cloacimonetes bacterium 4572_55]